MATAQFRIDPQLTAFLLRHRRNGVFDYQSPRAATLKNALEALGIPHTEVGRTEVNGCEATLDRSVRDADQIDVLSWVGARRVQPVLQHAFIADAHLGALARFLRMLGFDTEHDNGLSDGAIRHAALHDRRTVLTRDRELLKCREILVGAYVRARKPDEQLREIWTRFALGPHARPFTLCLCCNVALLEAIKQSVLDRLPQQVAQSQNDFFRCPRCERIYWPGSHHARMRETLGKMLGADPSACSAIEPY